MGLGRGSRDVLNVEGEFGGCTEVGDKLVGEEAIKGGGDEFLAERGLEVLLVEGAMPQGLVYLYTSLIGHVPRPLVYQYGHQDLYTISKPYTIHGPKSCDQEPLTSHHHQSTSEPPSATPTPIAFPWQR